MQVIDDGVYASYSGEEQYGTVAYIKEGEAYVFFTETLWSHYVEPLYETEGGAYLFYLGSTDEVKTVWYGAFDTAFDSLPKWNDDLAEQMIEIWRQTTEKRKSKYGDDCLFDHEKEFLKRLRQCANIARARQKRA